MNKQMSMSFLHDELKEVSTNKKVFLERIERIMPWEELEQLIRPHYYEGKYGNKPYELELMLRIHLLQNLYDLSDMGARNEVIDSRAFSDFCGVESSNQIPDGDTIGKFRKKERSLIPPLFLPRLPLKIRRKSVTRTHTPLRKELRGTSAIKHTLAWIRIQVLSITWRLRMTCEKVNTVKRLEDWFFIHCDNDWEHSNRIEIYNLDNPGWGVKIDLEETLLEEIQFDKVEYGDSEDRTATWLKCYKEEKIFIGLGSYNMLEIILQRFLDWAEFNTDTTPWDSVVSQLDAEIRLVAKDRSFDAKEHLRNIYKRIADIPVEHPQRKNLLKTFDDAWENQWD